MGFVFGTVMDIYSQLEPDSYINWVVSDAPANSLEWIKIQFVHNPLVHSEWKKHSDMHATT